MSITLDGTFLIIHPVGATCDHGAIGRDEHRVDESELGLGGFHELADIIVGPRDVLVGHNGPAP